MAEAGLCAFALERIALQAELLNYLGHVVHAPIVVLSMPKGNDSMSMGSPLIRA